MFYMKTKPRKNLSFLLGALTITSASVSSFEQCGAGMVFVAGLQCPDPSPTPAVLVVKQQSRKEGLDPARSFHWSMLSEDVLCLHL